MTLDDMQNITYRWQRYMSREPYFDREEGQNIHREEIEVQPKMEKGK